MHGNGWEWVQDWYGDYAAVSVADPHGASSGSTRVLRGGSWFHDAEGCRVVYRNSVYPGYRDDRQGLRLLRTAS